MVTDSDTEVVGEGGRARETVAAGSTRSPLPWSCPPRLRREGGGVALTAVAVVEAPERNAVNDAHVTVTNDGITYSAGPLVTSGGPGTYLTYRAVESRPSGEWVLGQDTFPAQGGGGVSVTCVLTRSVLQVSWPV